MNTCSKRYAGTGVCGGELEMAVTVLPSGVREIDFVCRKCGQKQNLQPFLLKAEGEAIPA
jgi:hypothetical protein